ncbi:MAG: hypothetical protein E4H20_10375 [Spirochaetales bacterium]|nr:MAG: hypothetical protein E4H20_10375 [Spirochaetales bacterium]
MNPGNTLRDETTAADEFDLTVTEYGPACGVITDTFSGQVKESVTDITYTLTEGYFSVMWNADT